MNEAARPVPARHRARLATTLATLALALVSAAVLAACGPGGSGSAAPDHKCADKIAQATTTTAPVIGLWACLTPAFQAKLKENGAVANGTFDGVLSIGVATRTELLGADADFATYELILSPGFAQQAGTKWVEITVWLDRGKVDNVGVGAPAF